MREIATRTVAMVLVLAAIAGAQESTHTGRYETEHFEIRYRPGSVAGASVERTGALAERDLERMCTQLGVKTGGQFILFLYDDADELGRVTGVAGTGGFSAGNASHLPYDNDQTRYHELVHVVAHNLLPEGGSEPRNLFFAEGLANACLVFVHGVHVHAVAKYYEERDALPALSELTGAADFYAWLSAHPGFNGYDVGGSYLRFLLDEYSPSKVAKYSKGMPAKRAFGLSEERLEKKWHQALDDYVLRPEVEQLLEQRHGESASMMTFEPPRGLPQELVGEPDDWVSLARAALHPANDATWTWKGKTLVGSSEEAVWSICELGEDLHGDCVIRARILTPGSGPIQIRLGSGNQAMLVNGTFLYRGEASVAFSAVAAMTPERKETDFVLVRRGGQIEIWIDEVQALTVAADPTPARVGVAFHQGEVTFRDLKVRPLKE